MLLLNEVEHFSPSSKRHRGLNTGALLLKSACFGGELFGGKKKKKKDQILAPKLLRGDSPLACAPVFYIGARMGMCVEPGREFGAGGEGMQAGEAQPPAARTPSAAVCASFMAKSCEFPAR